MKLSEIVAYRERLKALHQNRPEIIANEHFGPALHEVVSCDIQFAALTAQLEKDYQTTIYNMQQFGHTLDAILGEIDQVISSMQPVYFAESYRLYYDYMRQDPDELILNRRFSLPPSAQELIAARITSFSDWHHPAMIIRPGLEEWIDSLVACDPLYLVDQSYELLEPAVQRYNAEYQKRLRRYVIDEQQPDMLGSLPQDQFGFVLAYNLLNYKPLEIVRSYLASAYRCLRPGGVFAFTINDGDKTGGVQLAERYYMCYTPSSMIRTLAENTGYTIRQIYHIDSSNTWMELQKAGQKPSLRGGQTLAQIHHKNTEKH